MRVLSTLEKKIIDRICEGNTHISFLLNDHIPNLLIYTNRDTNSIELVLEYRKDEDDSTKVAIEQTEKIIYIIKFLLYLEEQGFIMTGHFGHGYNIAGRLGLQETFDKYDRNPNGYVNWPFSDDRTRGFIFNYIDLAIIPIHQLLEYKKNNYRTIEDLRHRNTKAISYVAISVSLILGFFSLYISTHSSNPTKEQISDIQNVLVDLKKQNESLPTKYQLDTLISKITKGPNKGDDTLKK